MSFMFAGKDRPTLVPYVVHAVDSESWSLLVYPNGDVRVKNYDEDHRGAGSRKANFITRARYKADIKEAIEEAWAHYDEEKSLNAANKASEVSETSTEGEGVTPVAVKLPKPPTIGDDRAQSR